MYTTKGNIQALCTGCVKRHVENNASKKTLKVPHDHLGHIVCKEIFAKSKKVKCKTTCSYFPNLLVLPRKLRACCERELHQLRCVPSRKRFQSYTITTHICMLSETCESTETNAYERSRSPYAPEPEKHITPFGIDRDEKNWMKNMKSVRGELSTL